MSTMRLPKVHFSGPEGRALGIANVLVALVSALLLLGLPALVVLVEALRGGRPVLEALAHDPTLLAAVRLTVLVTVGTVVVNTLLGTFVGWTIATYTFRGKTLARAVLDLPLSVSPVVAGLGVLLVVGRHSLIGRWLEAHGIAAAYAWPGILAATVFVTFPYIARAVAGTLAEQGRAHEEAALSLGASLPQTFWRVTLPRVRSALLDGVLLCNARALGEFGAVSVVSGLIVGRTETVPLAIARTFENGVTATAFAMSALLALVAVTLAVLRRRTGLKAKMNVE
jgi:sulfate transport system permease protein